jgi:hypothetical protein
VAETPRSAVDNREPVSRAPGEYRQFAPLYIHCRVMPASREGCCEDFAPLGIEAGDRRSLGGIHAAGDEEALAHGLATRCGTARKLREHERQDLAAVNHHRGC